MKKPTGGIEFNQFTQIFLLLKVKFSSDVIMDLKRVNISSQVVS